jgi:hypothetical protein
MSAFASDKRRMSKHNSLVSKKERRQAREKKIVASNGNRGAGGSIPFSGFWTNPKDIKALLYLKNKKVI